jgi:YVTN family beta-propeller protein
VSFGSAGAVGVIEPARRTCHLFRVGKKLSLVRFRSDGRQLLAGNLEDRSILVLSAPGGRTVVNLPLAVRPDHFCFNADQGQLFVTGEGMDAVVVLYPYQTQVAETVLAGRAPGAMEQCTTPDVSFLFVANPTSREVTILDIDTRRAIASATVGAAPAFITITPDSQYALVLNRDSGDMAVIRIAAIASTRAKSAPLFTMIPVGSGPVCAAVRAI